MRRRHTELLELTIADSIVLSRQQDTAHNTRTREYFNDSGICSTKMLLSDMIVRIHAYISPTDMTVASHRIIELNSRYKVVQI